MMTSKKCSIFSFAIPNSTPAETAAGLVATTFSRGGVPSTMASALPASSGSLRTSAWTGKFGIKAEANMGLQRIGLSVSDDLGGDRDDPVVCQKPCERNLFFKSQRVFVNTKTPLLLALPN